MKREKNEAIKKIIGANHDNCDKSLENRQELETRPVMMH